MKRKHKVLHLLLLIYLVSFFASCNTHDQAFQSAIQKFKNKNYKSAYKEFFILANKEDTQAQYYLGYMQYKGLGTNINIGNAMLYLSKAAKKKHIKAQYLLGWIYFKRKNFKKAITNFSLSSRAGNTRATLALALLYNVVGESDIAMRLIKKIDKQSTDLPDSVISVIKQYLKIYKKSPNDASKFLHKAFTILKYSEQGPSGVPH